MKQPKAFTQRIKCHCVRPLHACERRKEPKPVPYMGLQGFALMTGMLMVGTEARTGRRR